MHVETSFVRNLFGNPKISSQFSTHSFGPAVTTPPTRRGFFGEVKFFISARQE